MGKILHIIISILLMILISAIIFQAFIVFEQLYQMPAEAVAFVLVLSLLYMMATPYSLFNKSFYKSWK